MSVLNSRIEAVNKVGIAKVVLTAFVVSPLVFIALYFALLLIMNMLPNDHNGGYAATSFAAIAIAAPITLAAVSLRLAKHATGHPLKRGALVGLGVGCVGLVIAWLALLIEVS